MTERRGARLHVTGVVQGVGFRPFVYGLARELGLTGWVRNTSSGVDIAAVGLPPALAEFARRLRSDLPPLARIDRLSSEECPADGFTSFEIIASQSVPGAFQPISPDMCICDDCLAEIFDPTARRYRYPFTNCTSCGPRFTIIRDIPYDRPLTTMAGFDLCPDCAAEYADPLDRRFHAQPIACPACGPSVWLEVAGMTPAGDAPAHEAAIESARDLLADGAIVAVKGLGGFHLACDATNAAAVAELRRRKLRVDKPFAVMMPDLETVRRHCHLNEAETELLISRPRPIVLLARREESPIAAGIAPGQAHIGVMLPYTPLHYLLLEPEGGFPDALVMTSGNLSEEPIVTTNEAARERLAGLADALLLHNRDIQTRCDDSVMRVMATGGRDIPLPIRRSRGYAPFPVHLPFDAPPLLAAGAELKNTFCLTRDDYAFLSHHIGDLENYETLTAFEEGIAHLERLFRVRPEALAYDLHPNYLATRYALERAEREGLPAVGVQHHHAHIAAGMAEHGLEGSRPVIGLAFDGTGYGDDGAIWGGEVLVADYGGYRRAAHLDYVPLPGGDRAVREPWRMALSWLAAAGIDWDDDLAPVAHALAAGEHHLPAVRRQLDSGLNAPPTSSAGRLFDAAAALAGVRQTVNYEAQAAVEFEALCNADEDAAYPFVYANAIIDPRPALAALVADIRAGLPVGRLSARFHNGFARLALDVCRSLRADTGLSEVVLSGGVWQNMTLLRASYHLLAGDGFTVLIHEQVPANDGGLALGQAAVAAWALRHAHDERQGRRPAASPHETRQQQPLTTA